MIVDIKRKRKVRSRVIEGAVTTVGWVYLLVASLQVIASLAMWYFNINHLSTELFSIDSMQDTVKVVSVTWIVVLIGFLIMYFWRSYNINRFGSLRRRSFPSEVTVKEMAEHFQLSPEAVEAFQSEKIIELDETIV